MNDVTRRDFLIIGAGAISAPFLMNGSALAAVGAKKKLPAPTTIKDLIKKGQAEGGELLLYCGSADEANALTTAFHAAYPWATLNTVVGSSSDRLSRVMTETTAHASSGADVTTATPAQVWILIRAGAVAQSPLVNDANLPSGFADPLRYGHPQYINIQVLAYNPNLVTYPPPDIFQLSQPAWKGQLAMDRPDGLASGAMFLASHRKAWGDKKWMQWLQNLSTNNVFLTASATASFQAVVAGERGLCPDAVADVLSAPAGAPVKADFYSGMPPYLVSLLRTSYAPHPNMADLFMNFALTPQCQTAFAVTGRAPTLNLPQVATSVANVLPKGKTIAPLSSISGFLYNTVPYTNIWDKLWPS